MDDYKRELLVALKKLTPNTEMLSKIIDDKREVLSRAPVFILPENGEILADKDLKGLIAVEQIGLPYTDVVFQFSGLMRLSRLYGENVFQERKAKTALLKNVVLLQTTTPNGDFLLTHYVQNSPVKPWVEYPRCSIKLNELLTTTKDKININPAKPLTDISFAYNGNEVKIAKTPKDVVFTGAHHYANFLAAFLNVYALSNVKPEAVKTPEKRSKNSKRLGEPFSVMYRLTVELPTSKKSANTLENTSSEEKQQRREHLRRGHIRRLDDGRRIWVNAAIINAGSLKGTVRKDYALKAA